MPEPKRPCPYCSRLGGIHRGLSLHYAHRLSCFLAEKSSIRNSQTSQSNLPSQSNIVAEIHFTRMQHYHTWTTTSMSMQSILILILTVMMLCPVVLAMLVQENPVPISSRASLDWGCFLILMRSRQFLDLRPWMLRLMACLSLIAQV